MTAKPHSFLRISTVLLLAAAFLSGAGYIFMRPTTYYRLGSAALAAIAILYNPLWGVYLLPAVLPFVPAMTVILLGALVFVAFLVHRLVRGDLDLYPLESEPSLLLFIAVLAISTLASFNPGASLRDVVIFAGALGIFYVLIHSLQGRNDLYRWVVVAVSSSFVVAVYGLYQFVIRVPAESAWVDEELLPWLTTRVYSVFGNPNVLAGYLIMVVPLSLALIMVNRDPGKRMVFGAMSVALNLAAVLTFSRSGWMGLLASILVFFWLIGRKGLVVAMVVIVILSVFSFDPLYSRVMSMFDVQETSHNYRLLVWREAGEIIRDHPIAGIGMGHLVFRQVYPHYMITRGKMPFHAHNTFLQYAVEFGVPGLLIFLWFMFSVFRRGVLVISRSGDRLLGYAAAAGLSSVAGVLVQGFGDHIIYMPRMAVWFWMCIALVFTCDRLVRASQEQRQTPS